MHHRLPLVAVIAALASFSSPQAMAAEARLEPIVTTAAFITARPFLSDECSQLPNWCHPPEAHDETTAKGRDLQVLTKAPEPILAPVAPDDIAAFKAENLAWEPLYGFVPTDQIADGAAYAASLKTLDAKLYDTIIQTAIRPRYESDRALNENVRLAPLDVHVKDAPVKNAKAVCQFPVVGSSISVATKCAIYSFDVHDKHYVIARLGYKIRPPKEIIRQTDSINQHAGSPAYKKLVAAFDALYLPVLNQQNELGRAVLSSQHGLDVKSHPYHPLRIAVDNIFVVGVRYRLVAQISAYGSADGGNAIAEFAIDYVAERHVDAGDAGHFWELVDGIVPTIDVMLEQYTADLRSAYAAGGIASKRTSLIGCWDNGVDEEIGSNHEVFSHGYSFCFKKANKMTLGTFFAGEGFDRDATWEIHANKLTMFAPPVVDAPWPFARPKVSCQFELTDKSLRLFNCPPKDKDYPSEYRLTPS